MFVVQEGLGKVRYRKSHESPRQSHGEFGGLLSTVARVAVVVVVGSAYQHWVLNSLLIIVIIFPPSRRSCLVTFINLS